MQAPDALALLFPPPLPTDPWVSLGIAKGHIQGSLGTPGPGLGPPQPDPDLEG